MVWMHEGYCKVWKFDWNPLQGHQKYTDGFFSNLTGGGAITWAPPSTYRAITRQRAKLSPQWHFMTISIRVSRTFWHQICDGRGGTVPKLRNIVYMHVGPKMAPKCDFVYKINANWVFSLSSYKYAYFYSQLLKLITFWFIVLQKVSATNFGEKNYKNKRSKKQRNT